MIRASLLAGAATVALLGGAAVAQQQVFRVAPERSEVHFTLPDPLHTVRGTFKVASGQITFNPADGSMAGEIIVDAASGTSGDAARDRKMTSSQMQAAKFSTVRFRPTRFSGTLEKTGESRITVAGVFTLLGRPHEISVPMLVRRDGSVLTASGSFVVPYVQWGMKDPSVLLLRVGKDVKVDLSLTGTVAP